MITKITSKGNMVNIISDEIPRGQLISKREALKRAKAIIGMDKDSEWLVEELVKASNQAHINETGVPYPSSSMDLLLATAKAEADKQPT